MERYRPQPVGLGRVDPQTLRGMDDKSSGRMLDGAFGRLRQRQIDLGRLARRRQQVRLVQVALQLHVQADASQGLAGQVHDQMVLLLALQMIRIDLGRGTGRGRAPRAWPQRPCLPVTLRTSKPSGTSSSSLNTPARSMV